MIYRFLSSSKARTLALSRQMICVAVARHGRKDPSSLSVIPPRKKSESEEKVFRFCFLDGNKLNGKRKKRRKKKIKRAKISFVSSRPWKAPLSTSHSTSRRYPSSSYWKRMWQSKKRKKNVFDPINSRTFLFPLVSYRPAKNRFVASESTRWFRGDGN